MSDTFEVSCLVQARGKLEKQGETKAVELLDQLVRIQKKMKSVGKFSRLFNKKKYKQLEIQFHKTLDLFSYEVQRGELNGEVDKRLPFVNEIFLSRIDLPDIQELERDEIEVTVDPWSKFVNYPFRVKDRYELYLESDDFHFDFNRLFRLKKSLNDLRGLYHLLLKLFAFLAHKNQVKLNIQGNLVIDEVVNSEESRGLIRWLCWEAVQALPIVQRPLSKNTMVGLGDNYVRDQFYEILISPDCPVEHLAKNIVKRGHHYEHKLNATYPGSISFKNEDEQKLFRRNAAMLDNPKVICVVKELDACGMPEDEIVNQLSQWLRERL